MTRVGLTATAHYLPERWMTAAEVGAASGIPEDVVVEKFGLRGKHIAADDEHVTDLAVAAAHGSSTSTGSTPPRSAPSSTTARHGRTTPYGRRRRGLRTGSAALTPTRSSTTKSRWGRLSRCASVARSSRPSLSSAASCSSPRAASRTSSTTRTSARGSCSTSATAPSPGLLTAGADRNLLLGCHAITDGSFSLQVKVPAGGSVEPASHDTVDAPQAFPRRRRPGAR